MATFDLDASRETRVRPDPSEHDGMDSAVLLHNARWFTKIRWIVVCVLVLAGFGAFAAPGLMRALGCVAAPLWIWLLAGVLAWANIIFRFLIWRLRDDSPRSVSEAHIWMQIVFDLVILTVLVHLVGSVNSFISFTYLFHIVLACIFFPPRSSFLVTLLAGSLFLACVALELSQMWTNAALFRSGPAPWATMRLAGSAVAVWFVVWYLVASLSGAVRKRDSQLQEANRRLIKADAEKNRLVLRTTHDLKAPFSGIETNIQALRYNHWDDITPSVRDVIERIEVRAQTLSERIKDILALGDLRSRVKTENELVVLKPLLEAVVDDVKEKAGDKEVSIKIKGPPAELRSDKKQLAILFGNLVANAVLYSHDGGRVEVTVSRRGGEVCVSVSDNGIGIREDVLPHIFEEYFRANEAARFNKLSTGLGLAIVKRIAQNLGLKITVSSEFEKGTTFEIRIPKGE